MWFVELLFMREGLKPQSPMATGYVPLVVLLVYILLWLLTNVIFAKSIVPAMARRLPPANAPGFLSLAEGMRSTANYLFLFGLAVAALRQLGVVTSPILTNLVVVYLVLRFFLNNIVTRIIVPILARESAGYSKERVARVHTLAGVVRSTGNYLLTFIILLVALSSLGVNIAPVLASASVVGLAVGFGSQKLVRDVTTGFFLLAENQFDVGDYVTIGAVTGVVLEIGMRTTHVRDDFGKVYIVPNGDIALVCNHSTGETSLILDVPVAAATDLRQARAVVDAVGQQLAEEFVEVIAERPRVEGITAMTAAQVTLRIRYRADVALQERTQMRLRELLREAFTEEGIALV